VRMFARSPGLSPNRHGGDRKENSMTATPNPLHAVPDDDLAEEIELRIERGATVLRSDPAVAEFLDTFSADQLARALARRGAGSEVAR
jgi:hypothetical protein